MTKTEVIRYFGSQIKAAKALGVTQGNVSQWPEHLDYKVQCFIEVETKGALKAMRPLKKNADLEDPDVCGEYESPF